MASRILVKISSGIGLLPNVPMLLPASMLFIGKYVVWYSHESDFKITAHELDIFHVSGDYTLRITTTSAMGDIRRAITWSILYSHPYVTND